MMQMQIEIKLFITHASMKSIVFLVLITTEMK